MKQSSQQLIRPLVQQRLLQISAPRRDFAVLCATFLPLLAAFVVLLASCTGFHNTHPPKIYRDYSRYSYVDSVPVNDSTIESLAILGKVWGFVKYYHPVFEDSVFNVDYELFELLPKIIPADYTTRNKVLCDWIDSLGTFETDEGYYQKILADTTVRKMVSYDWMNDSDKISPELSGRLNQLVYAKRTGSNVYAGIAKRKEPLAEVYRFSRENAYGNLIFLDDGYRLLALFRYWNMVEYYYSAKHQIDRSWDEVLQEYIPVFIRMSLHSDYRASCYRLIAEIHDTHAGVSFPLGFFGSNTLPLWVKFVENSWVVTHNAKDFVGIRRGDVLLSIDGIPVDSLTEKFRPYLSYSNEAVFYRDAADCLQRTSRPSAVLKCKRGDSLMEVQIKAVALDRKEDYTKKGLFSIEHPPYSRINDSTGYVCIGKCEKENIETQIAEMLGRINSLVIDLRYGAHPLWGLAECILGEKDPSVIKWISTIEPIPGIFRVNKQSNPYARVGRSFNGKVILILNERVQSSDELLSVLLQTVLGARTIGTTTAGAGGAISYVSLPGGVSTELTSYEFLTQDGISVMGSGIPLDEVVPITIREIRKGRDEVYERALELVKTS